MDTDESGNATRQRVLVWAGLAIVGLLGGLTLVLLFPLPPLPRAARALLDMGHAPAFAVATVVLYRIVRAVRPKSGFGMLLLIALAMIVFGYGSEVVQSKTGRGYAIHDALADALGVMAAVCWCIGRELTNNGMRLVLALVATVALAIPSTTPCMVFLDVVRQKGEMPMLASFENHAELTRWVVREGRMARVQENFTDGLWALQVDLSPGEYPGVTMIWPASDWSNYDELVFDLTVLESAGDTLDDEATARPLILKIEDAAHNGEYDDRYHRSLSLVPGTQEIRVSLSEIEHGLEGRTLDLRNVALLQLFFNRPQHGHSFVIDNLRLE